MSSDNITGLTMCSYFIGLHIHGFVKVWYLQEPDPSFANLYFAENYQSSVNQNIFVNTVSVP